MASMTIAGCVAVFLAAAPVSAQTRVPVPSGAAWAGGDRELAERLRSSRPAPERAAAAHG
ncbi:MAG: hypothetical protein FD126_3616, partial [Elusimicrobia bacterium]